MSQDGHVLGREGAHNHDKPRTMTRPVIRRGNSMTKPISGRIWNEETKRSIARRKTTIEVNLIISTDLTRCHSKRTQLHPIA